MRQIILGGVEFGGEAFEVAAGAEIFIVDTGAPSCLALGGLGFVELCLCHIGSVLAELLNEFGASFEQFIAVFGNNLSYHSNRIGVHADVGMSTYRDGVGVVTNGDNQFAADVTFRHMVG